MKTHPTKLYPLLLLTLGATQAIGQEHSKPNVLLIYADDLGFGDLGCYGALGVSTPNIDRLAQQGLRFTNAHAMAATSTPSRYGMLTGQYAWRREGTGVAAGNAAMIIQPEQYTMADLFKQAGYRTAALGKWHLGLGEETGKQDWNQKLTLGPSDLGFDYSYIMAATADRVPCIFIEQERIVNPDPEHPIEVSYLSPFAGEPLGKTHPELLQLKASHGHDMAIVNGIGRIGYSRGGGKALWRDEDIADSITLKAQRFIEQNHNQSFFLYFATNDVHVPRFPHERFRGKSKLGLRGDAIVQFDWSVGQLLNTLDSLGIRENTLIILTSDNGAIIDDGYEDQAQELLGGHNPTGGLRGHKYSCYEGGTRVPMIVSWEQGLQGRGLSSKLFSQVDYIASFTELLGVQLPQASAPDSRPHLGALLGNPQAKPCPWLIEQAYSNTLSIRLGKWKYIEPSSGPERIPWGIDVETGHRPYPQLFDLEQDPSEQQNLAKRYPKVVRRLAKILQEERKRK